MGAEASCPSQEHGAAPGAPGTQLILPARPLLGGEPGLWAGSGWGGEVGMGEARSPMGKKRRAGWWEGLALRGFPLLSSSLSQQFSPASAVELWDDQVIGSEGT